MSFFKSRTFQSLFGMLISGGLIAWIIYAVNWQEVGAQIFTINYWIFIPALGVFVFHFIMRAIRWRYLLADSEDLSTRQLFDAIMVGAFATFILPLRAGEFIRPYMISSRSKHSFSSCFVSVVVERFFDLSVVLISFAAMLFFVEGIPDWVFAGAWSLSLLAVAIFIFMVLGSFVPDFLMKIVDFFLRVLPEKLALPLRSFIEDFLKGAAVLRRKGALLKVVLFSVLVWLSCYFLFYLFLYLFFDSASVLLGVSTAVIVALAVAAPSAPGFIGVYQTGCIAAFILFGLEKEIATAYSIVTHLFQYILFVLYGPYVLWRNQLKLSDLRSSAD